MADRELLYFPIVHSQADMGALNESIRKVTLQKLGERGWRRKVSLIDQFWIGIELALTDLVLSYEKAQKSTGDTLLKKRDQYIAYRIDQTLQQGETGILFLGMLHKIEDRLPGDIHVSYLINRPLDKRGD